MPRSSRAALVRVASLAALVGACTCSDTAGVSSVIARLHGLEDAVRRGDGDGVAHTSVALITALGSVESPVEPPPIATAAPPVGTVRCADASCTLEGYGLEAAPDGHLTIDGTVSVDGAVVRIALAYQGFQIGSIHGRLDGALTAGPSSLAGELSLANRFDLDAQTWFDVHDRLVLDRVGLDGDAPVGGEAAYHVDRSNSLGTDVHTATWTFYARCP